MIINKEAYVRTQEGLDISQWLVCNFAQKYETRANPMYDRCDSVIVHKETEKMYGMEFKDKSGAKGNYCFFKYMDRCKADVMINAEKVQYLANHYETAFVTVFFRDVVAVANVRDILKCRTNLDEVENPIKGYRNELNYLVPTRLFKTCKNEWFNYEK